MAKAGRGRSGTSILLVALALVATMLVACSNDAPDRRAPGAAPDPAPVTGSQPNIVLITTDDQTLTEMRWLPLTRRLIGRAGVTFTDFLANHPNCCPSRAELLTGQYAQNNGVRSNIGRRGGYDVFEPATALPTWLQRAGYATGLIGKYLNLYGADNAREVGWDLWDPTVDDLYQYTGFGQYVAPGEVEHPGGYHTDYVADASVEFIERQAGSAPFFLWSSYVAPHSRCATGEGCLGPPLAAERDRQRFRDVRPPFLDDPAYDRPVARADRPRLEEDGRPVTREQRVLFRARLQSLAAVDRAVERTVAALRSAGELDDTLIVFTSDNGFLFGEHRLLGKVVPFDQSVRVPLLVRGPGVRRGTERRTGAMIDLAPTFAALAGVRPSLEVDGTSLWPMLTKAAPDRDRTVLVQGGITGRDPRDLGWSYRGVRTQRYTFVRWTRGHRLELFDRQRDPHELRNVAGLARYAEVVDELRRRTRVLGRCAGPRCRVEFPAVPEPAVARGSR